MYSITLGSEASTSVIQSIVGVKGGPQIQNCFISISYPCNRSYKTLCLQAFLYVFKTHFDNQS